MWRPRGALRSLSNMAEELVLRERLGSACVVTLNNPAKLNALNLRMATKLRDIWVEEDKDDSCGLLILKGAGEKAFCAGGDVVGVRNSAIRDPSEREVAPEEFFRVEYQFDQRVAVNTLPQVSLWHGIVMGGGVGASVHGLVRVASEKTMFAMPETQIGLFPDVGGSFWMPRLMHGPAMGMYLGLTGTRLFAKDLLFAGIATHYCPVELMPRLEELLVERSSPELRSSPEAVNDMVAECLSSLGAGAISQAGDEPCALESALPFIQEIFGDAFHSAFDNFERGPGHAGVAGVEALLDGLDAAASQSDDASKQQWAQSTQVSPLLPRCFAPYT